jgi:hypothetical protein
MDRLGLQTLREELLADAAEAASALAAARQRRQTSGAAGLEAAGFQLVRLYNIVEQMALRVAKAFENNIDDESRWHTELMRRLSLEIPGVRPALWPPSLIAPMGQLRGFRHVFNHAYDLSIDPERLALVMRDAETVARALPGACQAFVAEVARRENWELGTGPSQSGK